MVVVLGDDRGLTEEEEQGIERLCDGQSSDDSDSGGPSTATRVGVSLGAAAAPGTTTQLHKMNLGPVCNLSQNPLMMQFRPRDQSSKWRVYPDRLGMPIGNSCDCAHACISNVIYTQQACLLGSHCIVLVHHYLDTLVHCCPGKLWEGAGEAVAKVSKQRQRRSKRRNKPPQEAQQQQGGEEVRVATVGCTVCGEQFSSRNQLFKHIKASDACRDRGGSSRSGGGGGGRDEEEARTASPRELMPSAAASVAADGADSDAMLPPPSS